MSKKIFFIYFILIIILINKVYAEYCEQETANVSTPCGGLDSGEYLFKFFWNNPEYAIDGDWDTFGNSSNGAIPAFLYVNYTKPVGARLGTIWSVKDDNDTVNITLPESCFNLYEDKLSFTIAGSELAGRTIWYCGVDAVRDPPLYSGYGYIYEEKVIWNISNIAPLYSNEYVYNNYMNYNATHILEWEDDDNLSGYIFSWCNESWNGSDCVDICYQETANVSSSCGSKDTGSYSAEFLGNYRGIFYINYTKPEYTTNVTWQVKHGNLFYNISLPDDCIKSSTVQLYIYSQSGDGFCKSYPACYNQTSSSWITIGPTPSTASGCGGSISGVAPQYLFDGNWNTKAFAYSLTYPWANGNTIINDSSIYEEAIYWHFRGWQNSDWTPMTGISNYSNSTSKLLSSVYNTTYAWCVSANDTDNNWNYTSCDNPFTYNSIYNYPYYENPSSTSPAYISESVTHSLNLYDIVGLSGYIFSWYNGTSWSNNSYQSISGTSDVLSESKTLTDISGTTYQWCIYFNNTNTMFNSTSCNNPFNYTSESRPVIKTWKDDCSNINIIMISCFIILSIGIVAFAGFVIFKGDVDISTIIVIITMGVLLVISFVIINQTAVVICK